MLKTRRQRSFWARIKLSIILFQTPRRAPDLNNFKPVPFLIFRNVDLREKKNNTIKQLLRCFMLLLFSLFFVLRLFFLTKDFALWLFLLSLPFYFKDQLLRRTASVHRKRKRMYHKTIHFVKRLFLFFLFFSAFFCLLAQVLQTKKY